MYAPLSFPIPTPVPHMRLGAIVGPQSDMIMMRPGWPRPSTGAGGTFVPTGTDQWLNLNTGEIIDGETMQNVAGAATINPSILTAPVASLPGNLKSPTVQQQQQSGTLPTAVSTGIIAGTSGNWFTQTTSLFGYAIPNWGLLAGAGAILFLFGRGRGRK